ncbi:MAG: type II secretion system F family protein [Micrococcales bacterium]|nr:type II secretion system F family protein [Micrococcales bacterium]
MIATVLPVVAALVSAALAAALATAPWVVPPRGGALTAERGQVCDEPPDPVLLLALLDAAITAGTPVPRALVTVGGSVGGSAGDALRAVGGRLTLGAPWPEAVRGVSAALVPVLDPLSTAWTTGAAPGPLLRQAGERVVRGRREHARVAAARLGVRLVLPLGLCLLPSFVLLGLLPVVLSLAGIFL